MTEIEIDSKILSGRVSHYGEANATHATATVVTGEGEGEWAGVNKGSEQDEDEEWGEKEKRNMSGLERWGAAAGISVELSVFNTEERVLDLWEADVRREGTGLRSETRGLGDSALPKVFESQI